MSRSFIPPNNDYIDSSGIVHNKKVLKQYLDELDKELNYQDGETYSPSVYLVCSGYVTNSKKTLNFMIPVDKGLNKHINSVSVNTFTGTIRHADGGYIGESNQNILNLGDVNVYKASNYFLKASIVLNKATTFANNSLISFIVEDFKVTFHSN